MDSDGEKMVLAEIVKLDVIEDGLQPIFAVIDSIKADRKKTWAENKLLKKAITKDRGHFDKDGGAYSSRPPRVPKGDWARRDKKKRLSVDQLKKVTRCANCFQKGYWYSS